MDCTAEQVRHRSGGGVVAQEFNAVNKILRLLSVVAVLFCANDARASDGFSAVRCGSDISKALIGRTMSNERVVVVEARHKNLGLKDLGGSEISERLFLISWRLCGDEYALLEEKDVVRDVLKFPRHSKGSPAFIGSCRSNGHALSNTIIAVLENRRGPEALRVALDRLQALQQQRQKGT
jgi:hypothetical protein